MGSNFANQNTSLLTQAKKWPESAPRLPKERFDRINKEYADKCVRLHATCRGTMVDERALVEMVEAAADAVHQLPSLCELGGSMPMTIVLDYDLGTKDDEILAIGLHDHLSEYSSRNIETEITSEVMAAWLGGVDNWFANAFMKLVLGI